MAQKPDKFPDWATEEEIDEVSGQANFVEPPDFRKESGWTRREIPPRQWFNWLARKTGLWVRWIEDRLEGLLYASEAESKAGTEPGRVISPLAMRQGLNAANAPPVFAVRAWAKVDGPSGNVAAGGNVSVVRSGEGEYTVTMPEAMPDEDYSVNLTSGDLDNAFFIRYTIFDSASFGVSCRTRVGDQPLSDPGSFSLQVVR